MDLSNWEIVTTPAATPTIAEAEAWLRLRNLETEESLVLELSLLAASEWADNYCRYFLRKTTAKTTLTSTCVEINGVEIVVDSVKIGATVLVVNTDYTIRKQPHGIYVLLTGEYEETPTVEVEATMGYTSLPSNVKASILQATSSMFNTRDDAVRKMPTSSEMLLRPYKIYLAE